MAMFARTPRLLLRPGWREDAPALHAAIADEAVVTMLARAPWPYRREDADAFLAVPVAPDLPRLLIFARTDAAPALVGGIELMRDADGDVEIGYWIARAAWGRGYATEAGEAVLGMAAMLRLPRIVAGHFVDNPASGRVLTKLGFVRTGRVTARYNHARGGIVPMTAYVRDEGSETSLAA